MARSRWLVAAAISALLAGVAPAPAQTLAQAGCLTDAEPNDTEAVASPVRGSFCVEGTLPGGDQDLALWEVGDEDLRTRWRIYPRGRARHADDPPVLPGHLAARADAGRGEERPDAGRERGARPGRPHRRRRPAPAGRPLPRGRIAQRPAWRWRAHGLRVRGLGRSQACRSHPSRRSSRTTTRGRPRPSRMPSRPAATWPVPATARTPRTVTEQGRWDVQVRAPLEQTVSLEVTATDGRLIGNTSGYGATLYDRALEPGTYLVRLAPMADAPRPYVLRAVPTEAQADPEPNDETVGAVGIVDANPVSGRLAGDNDRDRYRLTVPAGDELLRDVRMLWRSDADRTLCLLDAADERLTCRHGVGGLGPREPVAAARRAHAGGQRQARSG